MKQEQVKDIKHTPGPWEMVGDGIYRRGLRRRICVFDTPITPEDQSNAMLIAAAPDLLEACKALLDEFNSRTAPIETGELSDSEIEAIEKAEAAIQKAQGNS